MIGITMPNNINNATLARSVSLYTEYIISTQQGNERNKTYFALHFACRITLYISTFFSFKTKGI